MRSRTALLLAAALTAGCTASTSDSGSDGLLRILGASAPSSALASIYGTPVGTPASMSVTMYKLYISPNADCSAAVEAQTYGANGAVKDFTASPTLFQADVAPGSYPCVAINMSDVVGFTSDTDSLGCQTGTPYTIDVFTPESQETWLDINGDTLVATGTDSTPGNDRPWIFFATDTAAVMAAGYSHGQVIPLTNALVAPSTVTFVWDATNAVNDEAGRCRMEPGVPSFE